MATLIFKRIWISILVIFLITTLTFALVRILPGDPAQLALGAEASEADLQRVRTEYYLDQPIIQQYTSWISGVLHGNFGKSITFRRDILVLLKERLPATLSIGVPALVIGSLIGVIFGIISAVKRGKLIDQILTVISTIGIGTPVFWVGILFIYFFAMKLHVLPIQGYTRPSADFGLFLKKIIMPVACLSLSVIASVARQTRSNMLEIINQDYVRTARANGLSESSVIFRHALKNALIPVITIIAMRIRMVVGGSVLVEQLFNIPGVGTMLISAVNGRDYAVIQSCVLMISMVTVFFNLVVDILYGVVDPRIRKSKG